VIVAATGSGTAKERVAETAVADATTVIVEAVATKTNAELLDVIGAAVEVANVGEDDRPIHGRGRDRSQGIASQGQGHLAAAEEMIAVTNAEIVATATSLVADLAAEDDGTGETVAASSAPMERAMKKRTPRVMKVGRKRKGQSTQLASETTVMGAPTTGAWMTRKDRKWISTIALSLGPLTMSTRGSLTIPSTITVKVLTNEVFQPRQTRHAHQG